MTLGVDYSVREHDHGYACTATLKSADGTVVDLSGATAKFRMASPPLGTTPKVNAAATVVDAPNGKVSYTWQAVDTDTPGIYYAEWEVTFAGGAVQTFPNGAYLIVEVTTKVGG